MSVLYRLNIRFAIILALYGGLIFLAYRDEVLGIRLAPLAELTARITLLVIHWIGLDAIRVGALVSHPDGFAYEIAYTCTGFLPVMTFIVCAVAYPTTWWNRMRGIALGAPLLWSVNLLRLVHLFYLGVNHPAAFQWAHEVAWEGLQAVAFTSVWLYWMISSDATPRMARSPARPAMSKR